MYHCIQEQRRNPEIGDYTTYGIAAYSESDGVLEKVQFLSDLSTDPIRVERLAELCTAGQLEPLQLMDVAEDSLI